MTDETRQNPAETVSHEHLISVVHRRGSLTKDDYREAISDLARAMVQDEVRHICCSVCEDTGHTAETCHHNPLLLARQWSQATSVWCCYHCGFVATNDAEAREHFGFNEQVKAKCQRDLRKALKLAIEHIEHMAAWITKANSDYHVGIYSFESLGEDLATIKAPIEQLSNSERS